MKRTTGSAIAALGFAGVAAVAVAASSPEPGVTAFEVAVALCEEHPTASICTVVPTTTTTTAAPTTTTTLPSAGYANDFATGIGDLTIDVFHREATTDGDTWFGDHDLACGDPSTQRLIHEESLSEMIYWCPNGTGHWMSAIEEASSYDILSAAAPVQTDVTRVQWDVNITDHGSRKWPELLVQPAAVYDAQDLPCAVTWVPCGTGVLAGAEVGVAFINGSMVLNVGGTVTQWTGPGGGWDKPWNYGGDPARSSVTIRRTMFLQDNGDGTLTYGIETPDGTFEELTATGSLPSGDVRVVWTDHSYTPSKDPSAFGITHHWDSFTIN